MQRHERRGWGCAYLMAALIPVIGLYMGAVLYMRDTDDERGTGILLFALSLVSVALWAVLPVLWWSQQNAFAPLPVRP